MERYILYVPSHFQALQNITTDHLGYRRSRRLPVTGELHRMNKCTADILSRMSHVWTISNEIMEDK